MDLKIGDYVILHDPRLKGVFFMGSVMPMFILFAVYLFIVKYAGPKYMENKKAYQLKTFIAFYNIFQVVACVLIIREFFVSGYKLETMIKCDNPDFNEEPRMMRARLLWLGMKGIEFIETILFVLRKKQNQISFLHVYHHISTFFSAWWLVVYVSGGMLHFPIIINSVVHIVMYFYYFLSSFGPQIQSKLQWFKKFITLFQMTQLCMILVNFMSALMPHCINARTVAYLSMGVPNVFILLHLFYSFYKKTYGNKKPAKPTVKTN